MGRALCVSSSWNNQAAPMLISKQELFPTSLEAGSLKSAWPRGWALGDSLLFPIGGNFRHYRPQIPDATKHQALEH